MSSNPMSDVYVVHVVQFGDTLSGIARAYATTTDALAETNGLHDVNRLKVGQRLKISQRKKVCAVVPLFIDRDRNPIQGLRYRLESAGVAAFEGASKLNGLGERFIANVENEAVQILVQKTDSTWKLIHEMVAEVGEKLITLKRGKIRLAFSMHPHPKTPDGLPVSDPPPTHKPQPVPVGTPQKASGDMHHPAAHGSDKGMKGR